MYNSSHEQDAERSMESPVDFESEKGKVEEMAGIGISWGTCQKAMTLKWNRRYNVGNVHCRRNQEWTRDIRKCWNVESDGRLKQGEK